MTESATKPRDWAITKRPEMARWSSHFESEVP